MACVAPLTLEPHQHIASITKEHHTRRQNGELVCYIVEDKQTRHLILGQKLASIVGFLNTHVIEDKPDMVSVTGLHEIISCSGGRTGRWSKHRWRVQPVSIRDGAQVYEQLRARGFENCVIVGEPTCYTVAPSGE